MKNITLTLRVTPQRAVQILGRLYGCGEITREKYLKRLAEIDNEIARQADERRSAVEHIIANSRRFYERKTPRQKKWR